MILINPITSIIKDIKIIDILEKVEFTGFLLMIAFFILVAFVNIFQTSAVLKWSVLAPSIVPLFMRQNISPECSPCFTKKAKKTGLMCDTRKKNTIFAK